MKPFNKKNFKRVFVFPLEKNKTNKKFHVEKNAKTKTNRNKLESDNYFYH